MDKIRNLRFNGERKEKKQKHVEKSSAPPVEKVNVMLGMCRTDKERIIFLLGWGLGLRSIEITLIKCGDFDFKRMVVTIRKDASKGWYSAGPVPILSVSIRDEIKDYIDKNGLEEGDYLLNYSPSRKHYTTRQIRRVAKEVALRAGYKDFHIHMLRHSIARWLLENNYSINFVKRFMRHTNVRMTADLYGNFDIEDMLRIVQANNKPILVKK